MPLSRMGWISSFLLLLLFKVGWCAGGHAVIKPDPAHPGYYYPFQCVTIDKSVRGQYGGVRNSCAFDVEAHWQSATGSGSSWTLAAGEVYPLFEAVSGIALGCLPNDSLNRSLQRCKGERAPNGETEGVASRSQQRNNQAEASRLAKELGLAKDGTPSSSAHASLDADRLAQDLGVSAAKASSPRYTATQLESDIANWELQERTRQAEAEHKRQVAEAERKRRWEEQQRIETAKREEILREQNLLAQQQAEEEQQQPSRTDSSSTTSSGVFGTLLQSAANVYLQQQIQKSNSYTPSNPAGFNVNCNLPENQNSSACVNICNLPGHANDDACVRLRGGVPAGSITPSRTLPACASGPGTCAVRER